MSEKTLVKDRYAPQIIPILTKKKLHNFCIFEFKKAPFFALTPKDFFPDPLKNWIGPKSSTGTWVRSKQAVFKPKNDFRKFGTYVGICSVGPFKYGLLK